MSSSPPVLGTRLSRRLRRPFDRVIERSCPSDTAEPKKSGSAAPLAARGRPGPADRRVGPPTIGCHNPPMTAAAPAVSAFSFPTDIRFGVGARRLLAGELERHGVGRPLVVTDGGVAGLAFFADLLDDLTAAGLEPATFDGVAGNPVVSQVTAGVDAYRGHEADGIVGVGGGAALDVAKAIGLLATHPGELFDYEDEVPGARPIEDRIPCFVALPTTAGTGSEVGRSA